MVLEGCAQVFEPVPLLDSQITTPVRHFDITLQDGSMRERLRELIADADILLGTSGDRVIGSIGESRALLLRVCLFVGVQLCGKLCVVRNVSTREFNLSLLLLRYIGRRRICAEGVLEILFLALTNLSWDWLKRGEDGVRYAQCLLLLRFERVR